MLSSLQSAWPGVWISRVFFTSTATRRSSTRVCSVTTFCLLHSAITMMAVSGAPVPVSEDAGAGLAERRILSAETAKAVEDAQAVAGTANAELRDTTIILLDKASAAAVAPREQQAGGGVGSRGRRPAAAAVAIGDGDPPVQRTASGRGVADGLADARGAVGTARRVAVAADEAGRVERALRVRPCTDFS